MTESPDPSDLSFEERFTSLEASNLSLAGDVRALTATLQVINQMQVEQRETARRQKKTEIAVVQARKIAEERDKRTRSVVRLVSTGLALLLPLVSILVYLSLIQHVDALLTENNRTAFVSCTGRNATQLENAAREEALAKLESDPAVKKIHTDSALQLRTHLSNCDRWKAK